MKPRILKYLLCLLGYLASSAAYSFDQQQDTGPKLLISSNISDSVPALLMNSHLTGKVNGLVVSMTLIQKFKNNSKDWVNGRYVFPLPEGSTIDSLTLKNQDRILKGVVKEKTQAKKQFNQAKLTGKKAGLLVQNRPNVFTMSFANIAPQSTVEAEITWVQKVTYEGGVFSLSLPTTLTPRYTPQKSLQIKLSDLVETSNENTLKINQGWSVHNEHIAVQPESQTTPIPDSHLIDINITIDPGLTLDKVMSSSHKINVEQLKSVYKITFANEKELMDRDVLLQWQAQASSRPKAAVFSEQKHDDFYHLIMINPPIKNIISTLSKDVTFIVDTSGSMAGNSMEQAKNGLLVALEQLAPKDKFNIIEFNNEANALFTNAQDVSQHSINNARQFVRNLYADGGTEMINALQLAFKQPEHENYLRQIIFITDGAVGNEKQLFTFINQNLSNARLFTVGIGSAPNNHFMQGAAQYGRGTATQISNLSEVELKMTRLFEKLTYPVMRDIEVQWPDGIEVESYPTNIPDLYVSEPIMLMARSNKPIDQVDLHGKIANEAWQQTLNIESNASASAVGIDKIWAKDKINALIQESVLFDQPIEKYKDVIIKIGLQNQIVTDFTSFVAIEEKISKPSSQAAKDQKIANLIPTGKKISVPNTATPATLQFMLGLLILMMMFGYHLYSRPLAKAGLEYAK